MPHPKLAKPMQDQTETMDTHPILTKTTTIPHKGCQSGFAEERNIHNTPTRDNKKQKDIPTPQYRWCPKQLRPTEKQRRVLCPKRKWPLWASLHFSPIFFVVIFHTQNLAVIRPFCQFASSPGRANYLSPPAPCIMNQKNPVTEIRTTRLLNSSRQKSRRGYPGLLISFCHSLDETRATKDGDDACYPPLFFPFIIPLYPSSFFVCWLISSSLFPL